MRITDEEKKAIKLLKKHATLYGDSQYKPARWVVNAIIEASKDGFTAGFNQGLMDVPHTRPDYIASIDG